MEGTLPMSEPAKTTDLPARLRRGADRIEAACGDGVWASDVLAPELREAARRIEKLEAALHQIGAVRPLNWAASYDPLQRDAWLAVDAALGAPCHAQ
jgi:hypothetical protein